MMVDIPKDIGLDCPWIMDTKHTYDFLGIGIGIQILESTQDFGFWTWDLESMS